MTDDREMDIVDRLTDHWKHPASNDLREDAAKEITELRRACRAMAREIQRRKDDPVAAPGLGLTTA
jgi:hypothetical protein